MNRRTALLITILPVLVSGCSFFVPMEKPQEQGEQLLFWMPNAISVQVLSDWNEWGGIESAGGIIDPLTGRMKKQENGFWTVDISEITAGSYRYAFLVNGYRWIRDPENPETAVFKDQVVSVILISD
jgi:1,4-alpha-glucan branching enzyme